MPTSALNLLTLLRLPGVGPRGAVRLAEGDLTELTASEEWAAARAEAEKTATECSTLGVGIVGWFDADFPERLREIPDAPTILYYRGDLRAAQHPDSAAVVGTREPTRWGVEATRQVTHALAREGWLIISGLAAGVDTVAHRTALEAGASTIAILGSGLGDIYPVANRGLAEEIVADGGLLLAEVPPRRKVEPRALVKRDRLQSGLAAITVICQGGVGSGAMHTARYAYEQGRPLFCVALERNSEAPGEQDAGTQALLDESGNRLPELLPAWRRTAIGRLGAEPVARPLDEQAIADLAALREPALPPRLF